MESAHVSLSFPSACLSSFYLFLSCSDEDHWVFLCQFHWLLEGGVLLYLNGDWRMVCGFELKISNHFGDDSRVHASGKDCDKEELIGIFTLYFIKKCTNYFMKLAIKLYPNQNNIIFFNI